MQRPDNKSVANILYETADHMEVRNDDPFRIRSYRNAAEAIEGLEKQLADIYQDQKALLAIPGISEKKWKAIKDKVEVK